MADSKSLAQPRRRAPERVRRLRRRRTRAPIADRFHRAGRARAARRPGAADRRPPRGAGRRPRLVRRLVRDDGAGLGGHGAHGAGRRADGDGGPPALPLGVGGRPGGDAVRRDLLVPRRADRALRAVPGPRGGAPRPGPRPLAVGRPHRGGRALRLARRAGAARASSRRTWPSATAATPSRASSRTAETVLASWSPATATATRWAAARCSTWATAPPRSSACTCAPTPRPRTVAAGARGARARSAAARFDRVRLETGERQPEAMGLYRSAGYEEIERFGPYRDAPLSRCFERARLRRVSPRAAAAAAAAAAPAPPPRSRQDERGSQPGDRAQPFVGQQIAEEPRERRLARQDQGGAGRRRVLLGVGLDEEARARWPPAR